MEKTKFHTRVEIPGFGTKTGYSQKNLFMGSCFTENIGYKMAELKFDVRVNPFGIVYNPASVAGGLRILLEKRQFREEDLTEHDGLWHSFSHHGKFSGTDATQTLDRINAEIGQAANYLKTADFLFITFGTAWVYHYKKTGAAVSNCHKIPAPEFERFRLTPAEIVLEYHEILSEILKINPSIRIIFTVSPIRHWKDGAIENQRSKATLILAIDEIIRNFRNENLHYFPAYEIVMDELRDYRFYAGDMLHLSDVAVDHIWEIFQETFIDDASRKTIPRIENVVKAASHKPFNKNTTAYLQFLDNSLKQIRELETQFPNLNFELEKKHFFTETNEFEKNNEHF
jgi:hypothetical protein